MTSARRQPVVVHVTTVDMSLELLLGPQLEAFVDAGFHVVGASAPGPFVPAIEARGVEHVALDHATRAWSPRHDLRLLPELWHLFRRRRPDIVHTHTPKPGILGRWAAKAAGVAGIVNTVHGLYAQPDDKWGKRALVYSLERAAASCSDVELLQNPEDKPVLRRLRVPDRKLVLLGNGVDLERFRPDAPPPGDRQSVRAELGIAADTIVAGCVGRLVAEKGYEELFAAAVDLTERGCVLEWVVVGPDEPAKSDMLPAATIDRARRAGVRFLGGRDDPERLYRAMDIFVLPSHREGFSRSGMEAAASGLPIVTTDVRGCRQVVRPQSTGVLVPPRDAVALANAVERLAARPGLRRSMGGAARALAESEFDQQRQIDITLGVYRKLLRSA